MILRKLILTCLIAASSGVLPLHADTLSAASFSGGFGTSTSSELKLHSIVGEAIVGSSSNDQSVITSGSLASPRFFSAMVNEPPVILNNRDTLHPVEFEPFSVTIETSDPDNDSVALTFPVLPSYITRNGNTLSWTPSKGQADTLFKVVASDGTLNDTQTVYIKTVTYNEKPQITSVTEDTTVEGAAYSYTITGFDPENVPLKYRFIDYPSWLGSGAVVNGPTISGIPPEAAGRATFTVIAADDRWEDTAYVTLIITAINNPPVFSSSKIVTATEDVPFTYTASANDQDDADLDFWFTSLPENWKWSSPPENGLVTGNVLAGTPLDLAVSGKPFVVHVSDGTNEDSMEVTVDINFIEEKPVITSSSAVKVLTGNKILYAATAKDPEGGVVGFRFEKIPAWCVLQSNDVLNINATAFVAAVTDSFLLIAEDRASMKDSQYVVVKAVMHNAAPVITSPARVTAMEDSLFTYVVTVSDSDDVQWTFSYVRIPQWLNRSVQYGLAASKDTLRGIPDGTRDLDRFEVVVSDGGDNPDTLEVVIDITTKNDPPRLVSTPPTSVILGETFDYKPRAIDPEGNSFTFKLGEHPDGMTINSATGQLFWNPKSMYSAPVPVTVVVTDQYGDSSRQSFTVRVESDGRPHCFIDTVIASRGSVVIPFKIVNSDSGPVSLAVYYSTGRGWAPIEDSGITGKTSKLTLSEYTDTLVWNSLRSIPDGKLTTRIKIVPSDSAAGFEAISDEFRLDNTALVSFKKPSPSPDTLVSPVRGRIVQVEYSGPKLDSQSITPATLSITGSRSGKFGYSINALTSSKVRIALDSFPIGGEKVTIAITKTVRDTTGKGLQQQFTWAYSVALSGDFDYDSTVGFGDLDEAAMYWYASARKAAPADSFVNIGPASGTIPYLRPIGADSLFDFEDLSVFLSMWRYFASGKPSEKNVTAFSGAESRNALAKIVIIRDICKSNLTIDDFKNATALTDNVAASIEQRVDGFKKSAVLKVNVRGLGNLISARLTLVYDKTGFDEAAVKEARLFKNNDGDVLMLQQPTPAGTDIQMVRFSSSQPGVDGNGEIAAIELPVVNKTASGTPVGVAYTLVATDHRTVAAGKLLVNAEIDASPPQFRIDNFCAAPNPAQPGVRPVPMSFASSMNDKFAPIKSLGVNLAFDIGIPGGFKATEQPLTVHIVIVDNAGNVIAQAGERDFFRANNITPVSGMFHHQCYWDCRSQSGFPVPAGVYKAALVWNSGKTGGKCVTMVGVAQGR